MTNKEKNDFKVLLHKVEGAMNDIEESNIKDERIEN